MPCTPFTSNGMSGFMCGPARKCRCGRVGTRLCDWKVKGGTCSKPICTNCSSSPAAGKDLCPAHAAEWRARLSAKGETP